MDANLYPEPASESLPHCIQCGAPLRIGVANCDSCGLPVSIAAGTIPPPPTASAPPPPPPAAGEPATPPATHQDTAITATSMSAPTAEQLSMVPPPPTGPVRRCNWCGAMNPVDAHRCASCNATFPKPEQDDILTRASRERVRLAMQDIEEVDRRRSRSFFARLFR